MSTTSLKAGEVMDRAAALMNDPAKTDYTYVAQLPYLNMAIDTLLEHMQEANTGASNMTPTAIVQIAPGTSKLTSTDDPIAPHYPADLVEIQEISERDMGTQDSFTRMTRKDSVDPFTPTNSLMVWSWVNQEIRFNPRGSLNTKELQIKYVRQFITLAADETSVIGMINARSYLAFKTASNCSRYIGENETRAKALDEEAELALERLLNIDAKGRQEIVTRRQPFRRAYKSRGWSNW